MNKEQVKTISIAVIVCLSAVIMWENKQLRKELYGRDAVYEKFLDRSIKGSAKLKDIIKPGTMTMITHGDGKILCGAL